MKDALQAGLGESPGSGSGWRPRECLQVRSPHLNLVPVPKLRSTGTKKPGYREMAGLFFQWLGQRDSACGSAARVPLRGRRPLARSAGKRHRRFRGFTPFRVRIPVMDTKKPSHFEMAGLDAMAGAEGFEPP